MWEMILKEEDLGKMEGETTQRVYTHIGWANRVEAIWSTLGDTNSHLLDSIRRNIPQALIFMMSIQAADENDGAKFFTAVRNVQIEKVLGKAKESAAMRDLEERVAALSGMGPNQPSAFPSYASAEQNHRHTYVGYQNQHQPYTPQQGTTPPQTHNQHQPAARTGRDIPPHQPAPSTPAPYGQHAQSAKLA